MAVDLLVIHAISLPPGQFAGDAVDQLFLGTLDPTAHPAFKDLKGLRVSAHFLIHRHGDVTQYVPVLKRAWHAGESIWQERRGCNDFSVGIELEGDDKTPFTPVQYQRLATLVRSLQTRLPLLSDQNITGHQHIAPERKWDPGPFFDWPYWSDLLQRTQQPANWPLVWE